MISWSYLDNCSRNILTRRLYIYRTLFSSHPQGMVTLIIFMIYHLLFILQKSGPNPFKQGRAGGWPPCHEYQIESTIYRKGDTGRFSADFSSDIRSRYSHPLSVHAPKRKKRKENTNTVHHKQSAPITHRIHWDNQSYGCEWKERHNPFPQSVCMQDPVAI